MAEAADCDVLVVGYGPVGQTLTILLAQRGYRVTVLERKAEPYPRPRAVHYDDEIARIFAAAGIGDQVAAISSSGLVAPLAWSAARLGNDIS